MSKLFVERGVKSLCLKCRHLIPLASYFCFFFHFILAYLMLFHIVMFSIVFLISYAFAYCCSVYADGSISLDILQNEWRPIYDVASILISIQVLWDVLNATPCLVSINNFEELKWLLFWFFWGGGGKVGWECVDAFLPHSMDNLWPVLLYICEFQFLTLDIELVCACWG